MGRTAFIFPGQGSQYVGMGKNLYDTFPAAKAVFEEANEALNEDLASLCFNGPENELALTRNTQPAILTVSIAVLNVLKDNLSATPDFTAGHSLGEFSALVASGGLDLRDAVRIVRSRGEFMQDAVPVGVGSMAALMGIDRGVLNGICEKCSIDGKVVSPANFNSAGQIVISGHKEAVEAAIDAGKEIGCKRAVLLPVSAPFHSPLMKDAAEKLGLFLNGFDIGELKIPVVTNVEATANTDSKRVRGLLKLQMFSPVKWEDSVRWMAASGVTTFVELGPGKVLSGLVRRTVTDAVVLNVEDAGSLEKSVKTMKERCL